MNYKKLNLIGIITSISLCSFSTLATDFEVTALFGQMYGSDLTNAEGDREISSNSGGNFALAIAWQESPNGQGQIMLNTASHDFESNIDENEYSLDILYAHFNGIAQFRQQSYITTVSLGLGGAYFDSDFAEELYPSVAIALGTRYEVSQNLSLITELRGYASLVDKKDNLFCQNDICHAQFSESLWIDTNIAIGIAFKF